MKTNLKILLLVLHGFVATLAADEMTTSSTNNTSVVKQKYPTMSHLPTVPGGYPVNLPLCGLGPHLQKCLDDHGKIRLEIGDYRLYNNYELIVRAGQQIYALPGTALPDIQIQPGTENVILSGITSKKVEFIRSISNMPIRFNQFIRVNANFINIGSLVEENVFLYCNGTLHVNTASSGYMRNNRFIGGHAHGPSDMIYMMGDEKRLSYGNTFLWYNFLTPIGRSTFIRNQLDISFIGIDAEAWNINGEDPAWSPMLDLDKISVLRLIGANGGNGGLYPTPYIRANADQIQILNMNIYRSTHVGSPKKNQRSPWNSDSNDFLNKIYFGPDNRLSWISNFCCDDVVAASSTGEHFEVFKSESDLLNMNGIKNINFLAPPALKALHELFAPTERPGKPWEAASFEPLPDPAGSNWRALVTGAIRRGSDDSSRIQKIIDSAPSGIGFLPEGIYYIAKPLVVGKNKGLVGAGRDKTLIMALSDSLDMIVPGDSAHQNSGGRQKFILSDLTLQGGRSGIFHSGSNTGSYTQLNDVFLSHVQFREMAEAGILFVGIYGFDNNLFDYIAFVNCKTGVRQSFPSVPKSGENTDNNYIDKTIFYSSQFIANKLAVDFSAHRPDNLNAFIYSLFKDNEGGAVNLRNTITTLFAGSRFIGNGGDAVVNMSNAQYTTIVGSDFTDGIKDNVFFSNGVNVEGSRFSHYKNGGAKIFKDGSVHVAMFNSFSNVFLGDVSNGIFINSKFPDPGFDRFFVFKYGSSIKVSSSDYSNPKGEMLLDPSF